MKRISVVGQSGSGKTTLAIRLAGTLSLKHIELDAIHWQADWRALPTDAFRHQVAAALESDAWVTDGNYSAVQDLVLARADTFIWLDYPLFTVFRQLTPRTFQRVFLREELYNGNKERFWEQFLSRDSLFVWALRTHRAKRKRYMALLNDPTYDYLHFVRLRSPRELRRWLEPLLNEKPSLPD